MKKAPEAMRVLVLMQDDIIRTFVTRTLRSRGHEVVAADDPDEAIDEIDEEAFDVVTVEYQWIAAQGAGEYKRVRDAAGGRTKFILQAALAGSVPAGLIRRGLDEVLLKPFSLRQLVKAVETRRGRRRYQPNIQYRGLHA